MFEIGDVDVIEKPEKVRKIGIVSGDLNGDHPVQSFTKVFDDSRCVIISNSMINPNKFPNAKVIDISTKQDDEVYKIIKENEIDVLIDLSGNTNKNRMRLFSRKVCWRYISFLGYAVFCGLKTFDGYISDRFVETKTTNKLYGDKMMLMSRCFLNYNNDTEIDLKYEKGEKNVYGIMNRFSKMSKSYFKMLKLLLEKDSKAVLVFKCSELRNKECVEKIYRELGKERVKIIQWTKSFKEHLEELMKVDVCLDTFSYSGTTTTCDSLFVGTAVITLESEDKNYQNVSKSLLMNSDLGDYVCSDVESYIDKAISVAENMNINVKENIRKSFKKNIMNDDKYKEEFYDLICS
jgi:predicted O-linked N-acetylglucosamine transferase (SPINDLY family)